MEHERRAALFDHLSWFNKKRPRRFFLQKLDAPHGLPGLRLPEIGGKCEEPSIRLLRSEGSARGRSEECT